MKKNAMLACALVAGLAFGAMGLAGCTGGSGDEGSSAGSTAAAAGSSDGTDAAADLTEEEEASQEAADDAAYAEDTAAADYAGIVVATMGGSSSDMTVGESSDGYVTYEYATDNYSLYVEAGAESGDVTYVNLEVLEWGDADEGVNLIEATISALGNQYMDKDTMIEFVEGYTDGTGTVTETVQSYLDTDDMTFTLSPSDNGLPVLEVNAGE